MDISRRSILKGFGAMGLTALFRPKLRPEELVEIGEEDILEEYYSNPSAVDMVVSPQIAFRPQRIVIPALVAPKWMLENITIGQVSQFGELPSGLPGEMFSPDMKDNHIHMDAMHPGSELRMRIRRSGLVKVGDEAEIFQAVIMGRAVDGRMMMLPIRSDPYQICG